MDATTYKHPITGDAMPFDAWLARLAEVFVKGWEYTPENARAYVQDQPEVWRDFYDDEYSPEETALEDIRAGLE